MYHKGVLMMIQMVWMVFQKGIPLFSMSWVTVDSICFTSCNGSFLIFSAKVATAEGTSTLLRVETDMGSIFAMGMYSYIFLPDPSSNFSVINTSCVLGLQKSMSIWVPIHSVVSTNLSTSCTPYWSTKPNGNSTTK